MKIPVLVLLGFAAWTLLTLIGSVGVYRWSRILSGRASVAEWRADVPQGCEWYQRSMRAHMNCVENLPIFAALVVALMATGLQSPLIDTLAITTLVARVGQTVVHIMAPPSNPSAALRFTLFLVQVICMIAIGTAIVLSMT
ncbi:MAG: MAPEG family protein [Hyphomicrobiaceae bacterium]|nr:MAPEG family protein [Hyphomicrobiaceae bacterium]